MVNYMFVVALFAFGVSSISNASDTAQEKTCWSHHYDPFCLYECPATISCRPHGWHLVYRPTRDRETLVLRHSDFRSDDIMQVIKDARKQGKEVCVNCRGLVSQTYGRRHGFGVTKSRADYVCDECDLSQVISVSDIPLEFNFIEVQSSSLGFQRKARLFFCDDEKWNFNFDCQARTIWLPKKVADHLRKLLKDYPKVLINSCAFLDPSLNDDPNALLTDLPLEQLVRIPKQ